MSVWSGRQVSGQRGWVSGQGWVGVWSGGGCLVVEAGVWSEWGGCLVKGGWVSGQSRVGGVGGSQYSSEKDVVEMS